jgi:hypothetical protein
MSARGIERAAEVEDASFTLVICKKQYRMPRFQAAFISPLIHQHLLSDCTITEFIVDGISIDD